MLQRKILVTAPVAAAEVKELSPTACHRPRPWCNWRIRWSPGRSRAHNEGPGSETHVIAAYMDAKTRIIQEASRRRSGDV